MTGDDRQPAIRRHIDLTDADVEAVQEAARVLAQLGEVRPHEMTRLFYAMQYDNLWLLIEDLPRILCRD